MTPEQTYWRRSQRPLATMSVVLIDSRHSRGIDPKPGLVGTGYVELALGLFGLCAGLLGRPSSVLDPSNSTYNSNVHKHTPEHMRRYGKWFCCCYGCGLVRQLFGHTSL